MNAKRKGIAGATAAGIAGGFGNRPQPLELDIDLHSRVALVTGANSGLGKAIATGLAARGARVVMAGRTMDETARADVVAQSGNDRVHLERLDLASFASVRSFCGRMAAAGMHFSIVVLNAAVVTREGRTTENGLDEMTQVNFLSNVLLVETMLKTGLLSCDAGIPRIVAVNSEAHRWCDGVELAALGAPKTFSMKDAMTVYAETKFLMAAWLSHLARRLSTPTLRAQVFALCPGAVNTNIARQAPALLQPLLKVVFALFFASPPKAARPVLHLAGAPSLNGRTGVYFHLRREKAFDPRAADDAFGRAVYERALAVIGQASGESPGETP